MDAIMAELVRQLPSAFAILIVVIVFIQYVGRRDAQESAASEKRAEREGRRAEQEDARNEKTLVILANMTAAITEVTRNQDAHHTAMLTAVGDMKRASRRRKDDTKPL